MPSIVPNFAYFISFIVTTPSKRYYSQVNNLCNFTLLINGRTRIKNQICWILSKYAFNYFIILLFKGYKNKYDVISISCSRLKLNGTENDKNFCFISTRLDTNPKPKNKTFAIIRYNKQTSTFCVITFGNLCLFHGCHW